MKFFHLFSISAVFIIAVACTPGCGKKISGGSKPGGRYTEGGTHEVVTRWWGGTMPNEIKTYDGKKLIKKTHYHVNGVCWSVQNYDGKETYHGSWNEWFDNKRLASQKNYINNQKDGLFIEWHKNGQKKFEGRYEMDKGAGEHIEWYKNGQVKKEMKYTDGRLEGTVTEYYEDGAKAKETPYANGQKNGLMTEYYPSGKKKLEKPFANDLPNGLTKKWFESGQLEFEIGFKDKKFHGKYISYDKAGNKATEGQYDNDNKTGHWVYYKNGVKDYEGDYVNHLRHGTFKWYSPSGTVTREETYSKGKLW